MATSRWLGGLLMALGLVGCGDGTRTLFMSCEGHPPVREARITGRLLDAEGTPVAHALCQAWGADGLRPQTRSGEGGRFTLTVSADGRPTWFFVQAGGWLVLPDGGVRGPLGPLAVGASLDLGDLRLQEAAHGRLSMVLDPRLASWPAGGGDQVQVTRQVLLSGRQEWLVVDTFAMPSDGLALDLAEGTYRCTLSRQEADPRRNGGTLLTALEPAPVQVRAGCETIHALALP